MAQNNVKQSKFTSTGSEQIGEANCADKKLAQKSELEGPAAYAPLKIAATLV